MVLLVFDTIKGSQYGSEVCNYKRALAPRPHSVTLTEFGAVGDGATVNTLAFQNAIFYLRSFADKGGAQLYVPKGKWLTGSFNLISHLTLSLDRGAVIIATQVIFLSPGLDSSNFSFVFCLMWKLILFIGSLSILLYINA